MTAVQFACRESASPSVTNPSKRVEAIETYVQKLLSELGEPIDPANAYTKIDQAQAVRILSSRDELPQNVVNIATQVQDAPFLTVLQNSLIDAGSFLHSAANAFVSTLFFPFKYILRQFFDDTQEKEGQELFSILSQLKHEKCLTPKQQLAIASAFQTGKFDDIERNVLSLLGCLGIDPQDQKRIRTLLLDRQIVQVFRYLQTLVLFNKLDVEQSACNGFLTDDNKRALKEAHKKLQEEGAFHDFNQLLLELFSRLHTHNWLKARLSEFQGAHSSELVAKKEQALKAIKEDRPDHFKEAALSLLEHLVKSKEGLEKAYLDDVILFMKKNSESTAIFTALAHQLQQERYLRVWGEKAVALLALLEREKFSEHDLECAEITSRLDEVGNQMLQLYGQFGKVLESEKAAVSRSLHAAQYGKVVQVFRRVNEQFIHLVPEEKLTAQKGHFLCSCLYGRHVHVKTPDLKWKALPENLSGISKIDEIPHDLLRKNTKNLLFLNCTMGGSHVSATDAIIKYTKTEGEENPNRYHVRSLNVPLDVFLPVDPVRNLLGRFVKEASIDWVFNSLMTREMCRGIAAMRWFSSLSKPSEEDKRKEKELLREAVLKERPDILVMTYDWHAGPICEVAEELGIPVLRVELDYDLKGYEGVKIPRHFKVATIHPKTLPTLDGDIRKDQVEVLGPPLRPEFLEEYPPERILEIRKRRGIQDDEQVIFMSNGALGVESKIPNMIASWQDPGCKIRLIVVCGRNLAYEAKLKKDVIPNIVNKDLVKIEAQGFTDARGMAELMRIAHVCVSKPGSVIAFEALYSRTRFLSDMTAYRLEWEEKTTKSIMELKAGDRMEDLSQLRDKIKEQLALPRIEAPIFPEGAAKKYAKAIADMIRTAESDQETVNKRRSWEEMNLLV